MRTWSAKTCGSRWKRVRRAELPRPLPLRLRCQQAPSSPPSEGPSCVPCTPPLPRLDKRRGLGEGEEAVLEIEPRTSCVLSMRSTTELDLPHLSAVFYALVPRVQETKVNRERRAGGSQLWGLADLEEKVQDSACLTWRSKKEGGDGGGRRRSFLCIVGPDPAPPGEPSGQRSQRGSAPWRSSLGSVQRTELLEELRDASGFSWCLSATPESEDFV
ncbi:uncharacterized protein LOC116660437 [Camelus ferus]|nr:uncharacterized protein LOC116660437 [Camelus ferus]